MNRRPFLRALLASAAVAAAVTLAACNPDTIPTGRSLAPLSEKMMSEIKDKRMAQLGSPPQKPGQLDTSATHSLYRRVKATGRLAQRESTPFTRVGS